MARFMEIKAMNPNLTQNESTKQLGYSSVTVKRYRNDINMPSLYGIQSNTNKRKEKVSNGISNNEHEPKVNSNEPKRAQNDLAKPDTNAKSSKRKKINLKTGSVHENIEINDEYLDEILHKNTL